MRINPRFFTLLVTVGLLWVQVACSPRSPNTNDIIGIWEADETGIIFVFLEDYRFEVRNLGSPTFGTYELTDNEICLTISDDNSEEQCTRYTIADNALLFGDAIYTRAGSSSSQPNTVPTATAILPTPDNSPVGSWQGVNNGDAIILTSEGTFTATIDGTTTTGTWDLNGPQLCLTHDDASGYCLDYKQNVDAMKLGGALFARR